MLLHNITQKHVVPCNQFVTGTVYTDRSGFRSQWDPKNSAFIHHKLTLPQDDTWVEVSHCHSKKRGKGTTTDVYWTYLTPNSGIRMFTGKMIGFRSHHDAALSLNMSCNDKWCESLFHDISSHYKKNYDTMYFTYGETAHRCNNSYAIEIVWLKIKERNTSACLHRNYYRDFYFQHCNCREIEDCITCSKK
tara:strand:- start:2399 stop:2971 length:573 start_codon:yes stop_codon:yes gene_type:complete